MKKHLLLLISLMAGAMVPATAQNTSDVKASNVKMTHDGSYLNVDMDLDLSNLNVKSNRAVLIVPTLVGQNDTLELNSVGVYGRNRYYYYMRNDGSLLGGKDDISYRAKSCPDQVNYSTTVSYENWFPTSKMELRQYEYGCCNSILADNATPLDVDYADLNCTGVELPELIYKRPDPTDRKTFTLKGSALIHFPVNKTTIYPSYISNTAELGKISNLIDSIKGESDITIAEVTLKGYASPEGSYANNKLLAEGRTKALKDYVDKLYNFDKDVVKTEYEPEDWAGLKNYVEQSTLAGRKGILELIDSDMEPDAKEAKIRAQYPSDYSYLLQNCYPYLRHTDYTINCDVRRLIEIEDIRKTLKEKPQLVSLNEIYKLADTYESGSDEFNELYETAVRLYPNDEIANLNVANNAIRRGELDKAAEYLTKAGDSAEATYTRGVVAYLQGDNAKAIQLLQDAKQHGITTADDLLSKIK